MSGKKLGLSGLTWSSARKHPAILPIYVLVGAGCVMAGLYVFRLAAMSPEVSWAKRSKPEPWNDYTGKQYKFLATRDYSEGSPAPDYTK